MDITKFETALQKLQTEKDNMLQQGRELLKIHKTARYLRGFGFNAYLKHNGINEVYARKCMNLAKESINADNLPSCAKELQ